ncbi:MAG: hypothetical protein COA42_12085 [Alteromonadaceae bacterium]|nr:MAG: hypothetical protein COA42_12085 [Alteromonadaceae bacterium]
MIIDVEVKTNIRRIDCVVQTDSVIYVIEFKFDKQKRNIGQWVEERLSGYNLHHEHDHALAHL